MKSGQHIKIPVSHGGRRRTKKFYVGFQKRAPRPVHILPDDTGDTLVFKRVYPKCTWVVPKITVPLYWFDMVMLNKKLIVRVTDTVFICDGRRFKVIAQDWKVIGIGYTRWLVYEEPPTGVGVP